MIYISELERNDWKSALAYMIERGWKTRDGEFRSLMLLQDDIDGFLDFMNQERIKFENIKE